MQCRKCGQRLDPTDATCPACGAPAAEKPAAVLKTSTILISGNDGAEVYRSVEEVPEPLRKKLLRSTNSVNARTILIADRRGRREIARALRKLPGAARSRLTSALSTGSLQGTGGFPKLTIAQTIGMLIAGASAVLAWLILSTNGEIVSRRWTRTRGRR